MELNDSQPAPQLDGRNTGEARCARPVDEVSALRASLAMKDAALDEMRTQLADVRAQNAQSTRRVKELERRLDRIAADAVGRRP